MLTEVIKSSFPEPHQGFISCALKCPALLIPKLLTQAVPHFFPFSGHTPGSDDTFLLPGTRTVAFQSSACHRWSPSRRPVPMPQLIASCCCLGELNRGSCQAWEMVKRKSSTGEEEIPSSILVSFLTVDFPLRLQHQGVIYVLKLIKRLQCPQLQNRAQRYFPVYTFSDPSGP